MIGIAWKKKIFLFFIIVAVIHLSYLIPSLLRYVKSSYFYSFNQIVQGSVTRFSLIHRDEATKIYSSTHQHAENFATIKKILLWNIPSAVSYPKILDPSRCGRCDLINDREMAAESDAIVLHYHNSADLPPKYTRQRDQVYVWLCRESPNTTIEMYNLDLSSLDNVMNWTMTYRTDSDVFFPYAEVLHRTHDEKHMNNDKIPQNQPAYINLHYKNVDELIKGKKHLAAWVVGNCFNTHGAKIRMDISQSLINAGMEIHRFGKCFPETTFPPYRSDEANALLSKYKFYLAFENTYHCRDYVTYKFWRNSLYSGAVPIVWGAVRPNLIRLAPRHSFIHVEDFETLEDLVKYIKFLDSNDTAYREYFKWRESELDVRANNNEESSYNDWIFSLSETFGYCKLCRMLHEKDKVGSKFKHKSIRSLAKWWYGTESRDCIST